MLVTKSLAYDVWEAWEQLISPAVLEAAVIQGPSIHCSAEHHSASRLVALWSQK